MDPKNIEDIKTFFGSYKEAKPSKASELFILGYLSHKDMSGYDIFKFIEKTADTGGTWYKMNKATVYNTLNRMSQDGLIEITKTVRDSKRPIKDIYRITDHGKEFLKELVLNDLHNPPIILINFIPALFFSRVISTDELKDALKIKIEQISFIIELNKNISKMSLGTISELFIESRIEMYGALLKYLKKVMKLAESKPIEELILIKDLDRESAKAKIEKHFKRGVSK